MNIKINGISLEQYNNTTSFEELKIVIENFDPNWCLSLEDSIMGDMIKGAMKGTGTIVKTGIKGVRAADKVWAGAKTKWAEIKPKLIKLVKDFGIMLSNMWGKFMSYDAKYTELGQKINDLLQFTINQMQDMPSVTLYYHEFNARALKDLLEVIVTDYGEFSSIVKKLGFFNNNFLEPEEMAKLIVDGNTAEIESRLEDFSKGIAKMNANGEQTIIEAINKKFGWRLFDNLSPDNAEKFRKKDLGLSELVKLGILNKEIKKSYNSEMKQEFVNDMVGNNRTGFLNLVASILNNKVLEDALKKGGPSVKKETDKMIKYLENVMKQAEVIEKREAVKEAKREKEEKDRERLEAERERKREEIEKRQSEGGFNTVEMPQFDRYGGDEAMSSSADRDINDYAEMYMQNAMLFFTKLGNNYGSVVRGILSASYEIISEASSIVAIIESSATKVKN